MSAPERIWVDDDGYWFDIDPSETRPEYIRKDASDAAIAAARAEGVRAAMERSEEAFMDAVWSALKADANDLRKQQRILRAYRAAAEAQP